jgi:hypothetical protein
MYCEVCAHPIQTRDKTCVRCGSKLPKLPVDAISCPRCGLFCEPKSESCPRCYRVFADVEPDHELNAALAYASAKPTVSATVPKQIIVKSRVPSIRKVLRLVLILVFLFGPATLAWFVMTSPDKAAESRAKSTKSAKVLEPKAEPQTRSVRAGNSSRSHPARRSANAGHEQSQPAAVTDSVTHEEITPR